MDATLRRVAPLSGALFAVLYFVGMYLTMDGSPTFAGKPDAILGFYEANHQRVLVGSIVLFASLPFWFLFLGSIWAGVGAKESVSRRLAATILAAGAAGAAVDVSGESLHLMASVRADEGSLTPTLATVYFDAANVLSYTGATAALAAFALGIGIASLRYGAIVPKWLGALAFPYAVLAVIPMVSWALMFPGLLLIIVVSILLFRQRAGEL